MIIRWLAVRSELGVRGLRRLPICPPLWKHSGFRGRRAKYVCATHLPSHRLARKIQDLYNTNATALLFTIGFRARSSGYATAERRCNFRCAARCSLSGHCQDCFHVYWSFLGLHIQEGDTRPHTTTNSNAAVACRNWWLTKRSFSRRPVPGLPIDICKWKETEINLIAELFL